MVRIAISQAAFEAIAKTLPLGSVGYENEANKKQPPRRPNSVSHETTFGEAKARQQTADGAARCLS